MMVRSRFSTRGDQMRRDLGLRPRLERLEARLAPAIFAVNTTADTVAVNLNTGQDATGHISLRSAIMAANSTTVADVINLPPGTYALTIAGPNENQSATGDLDILADLTINGAGASATTIDGGRLDRVFEVRAGNVAIAGVTITRGFNVQGAGIMNNGASQLVLLGDIITGNFAIGDSGSPGAAGAAGGFGGPAIGGGVMNQAGTLAMVNCVVVGNGAVGGNGGAGGAGTSMVGTNGGKGSAGGSAVGHPGGVGGSASRAQGAGVFNQQGAVLALANTVFANNVALGGTGGRGGNGGNATGGDGGMSSGLIGATGGAGGGGAAGAGGAGGSGGAAAGGGLFNRGIVGIAGAQVSFLNNFAISGAGGAGGNGGNAIGGKGGSSNPLGMSQNAGNGGPATGGAGGTAGSADDVEGGGIANDIGATLFGSALTMTSNRAIGGNGGAGGAGGSVSGGQGGLVQNSGGNGGPAVAANAGFGGNAGLAVGGGLFNNVHAIISFTANLQGSQTAVVAFSSNQATGGNGGNGGAGGSAAGGTGGDSLVHDLGASGKSGKGGSAQGGVGGGCGAGNNGRGGGVANGGDATFAGVTLNLVANQASGGSGGEGGFGGNAIGGNGGAGLVGSAGGNAIGGTGGLSLAGGNGLGGGLINLPGAALVISPRRGAGAGSLQATATNTITQNAANRGFLGNPAPGGIATGGAPGRPGTTFGTATAGLPGGGLTLPNNGVGGGLFLDPGGTAQISNTTITGNTASTGDDDVSGMFTPAP